MQCSSIQSTLNSSACITVQGKTQDFSFSSIQIQKKKKTAKDSADILSKLQIIHKQSPSLANGKSHSIILHTVSPQISLELSVACGLRT